MVMIYINGIHFANFDITMVLRAIIMIINMNFWLMAWTHKHGFMDLWTQTQDYGLMDSSAKYQTYWIWRTFSLTFIVWYLQKMFINFTLDLDSDMELRALIHGHGFMDSCAWIHGSKCKNSYILDPKPKNITIFLLLTLLFFVWHSIV